MQRINNDFNQLFNNNTKGLDNNQYIYYNHRLIGENIYWGNRLQELKDYIFKNFDLVVENSRYPPDYLRNIYALEFYKILMAVQEKLEQANKQAEKQKNS